MAQEIFICYRRSDTGGYAGRLFDHLTKEYGSDAVLFDVEIEGTAEILQEWVNRVVPSSSVVLVLIGHKWIENDQGRRRLEEPQDIVRFEIELALSNEVPLIPILIDGAPFPIAQDIPDSIRKLVHFKGYEINNSFWEAKLKAIIEAISSVSKVHTIIIRRGVSVWNTWRKDNENIIPNLTNAHLAYKNLDRVNLSTADLRSADLQGASLREANLFKANLSGANLSHANLENSNAEEVNFTYADLRSANLKRSNIIKADLSHANLNNADLRGGKLDGCQIFGVSVWNTLLEKAQQKNLRLKHNTEEHVITVDDIQMAIILHLFSKKGGVREILDTLTRKVVLILGRFTKERLMVIRAIEEKLLKLGYLPIIFDFEKPMQRSFTETTTWLAGLSLFIIADITDAKSIPQELITIIPNYIVPLVPIIQKDSELHWMLNDLFQYQWVLPVQKYDTVEGLIKDFEKVIVKPAFEISNKVLKKKSAFIKIRKNKDFLE